MSGEQGEQLVGQILRLVAVEGDQVPVDVRGARAIAAGDAPMLPAHLVARLAAAVEGRDGAIALAGSAGEIHPVIGLWPVALAGVIFAASSRPQVVDVGSLPGADKGVHFLVYGLLGILCCRLIG